MKQSQILMLAAAGVAVWLLLNRKKSDAPAGPERSNTVYQSRETGRRYDPAGCGLNYCSAGSTTVF